MFGLLRLSVALPVLVRLNRRESEVPAGTLPTYTTVLPLLTFTPSQARLTWTFGAGGGSTVAWTEKVNGLFAVSLLLIDTVPVKVPPVLERIRTRTLVVAPGARVATGVTISLQLAPETSVVGLVIVSVALPVLVRLNSRESGVPAGTLPT